MLAPLIARKVRKDLGRKQYDVLFAAYSFHALFRVRPPYPMVVAYTSDATPTVYKSSEIGQSFGSFFGPSRWIDPLIKRAETRTFHAADLLFWPSNWMRDGANAEYDLDPKTSLTVPWGANITPPDQIDPPPTIGPDHPLNLLFLGRDWFAKGGPLVMETLSVLRERGIDTRLTVVGCEPPAEVERTHMSVYSSLNKAVPEELTQFQMLFQRAHFMVMASMESYGFAFCEASAYGVPSICSRIGGVPVRDGVNGHAVPLGGSASDFADIIQSYVTDAQRYVALRASSRREYEEHLNWPAWGAEIKAHLVQAIAERPSSRSRD